MLSYVQDKKGQFLFGNARAQKFFNTGIDVTIDGKYIEISPEILKEEELKELDKVLTSGKCYQIEKTIKLKNGDYSRYRVHKTPLKSKNGKI